ncbi:MAG: hypothetical protein WA628_23160 [Terriglobales bacterium]
MSEHHHHADLIMLTYLVGLGGFHHTVAGSTTVFFLVVGHSLPWAQYFLRFFLPTCWKTSSAV